MVLVLNDLYTGWSTSFFYSALETDLQVHPFILYTVHVYPGICVKNLTIVWSPNEGLFLSSWNYIIQARLQQQLSSAALAVALLADPWPASRRSSAPKRTQGAPASDVWSPPREVSDVSPRQVVNEMDVGRTGQAGRLRLRRLRRNHPE